MDIAIQKNDADDILLQENLDEKKEEDEEKPKIIDQKRAHQRIKKAR